MTRRGMKVYFSRSNPLFGRGQTLGLAIHQQSMEALMERKRVGIVIYEEVEVLDFCGPFEVFSVTRVSEERRRDEPSPFLPLLIAEHSNPVTATGGMQLLPHHSMSDCPPLDIVVVPGGWGFRHHMKNVALQQWLRARAAQAETVTAVCTGSLLLSSAGLLDGLRATTHWRFLETMRDSFPEISVQFDKHFVQDGRVLTSAGISAGIDMSLKVVEQYFGEAIARATARHMEYPYPDTDSRRIQL
jgi:transcriptional regulator GlxA family with amidase domain